MQSLHYAVWWPVCKICRWLFSDMLETTKLRRISPTYLLHLELDGGSDLISFGSHALTVTQNCREFTSFVKSWAQHSWDGLDDSVWCKESIVLLSWNVQNVIFQDWLSRCNCISATASNLVVTSVLQGWNLIDPLASQHNFHHWLLSTVVYSDRVTKHDTHL